MDAPLPARASAAAGLQADGAVALPVAADSAARLLADGNDLHLWINGPDSGTTTWLRLSAQGRLEPFSTLDFTCAGAALCGDLLLLTGADGQGQPLVAGYAPDGGLLWRHRLDGPPPTIWPMPTAPAGRCWPGRRRRKRCRWRGSAPEA